MKNVLNFFVIIVFSAISGQFANANVYLGSDLNVINVFPVASVTASGDSAAFDMKNYDGQCAIVADVSAPVAGTSPTLDVSLKESAALAGTYTSVSSTKFIGGAFSQVTSLASMQKRAINKTAIKRFLKFSVAIGGTASPQYLLSAKILCDKKYK